MPFQIVAVTPHARAEKMRRQRSSWAVGRINDHTATLFLGGFADDEDAMAAAEGLCRGLVWAVEKYE
jgi:hypothetical protein